MPKTTKKPTPDAEQAVPEAHAIDTVAVLEAMHAGAQRMSAFVTEHASKLLPMVLQSMLGYRGPARRKAIAKLKKMLLKDVFGRIAADRERLAREAFAELVAAHEAASGKR